jgi:hypothetical protein
MDLVVMFKLTSDTSYIRAAGQMADYLLGKNPLDISYITGVGYRYPLTPHARIMQGDGIALPVPGYVVGGANGSVPSGDGAARLLNGCVLATCYVDVWQSYATNEIAINWQSPVLTLFGAVDAVLGNNSVVTSIIPAPMLITSTNGNGTITVDPVKSTYAIGDVVKITAVPDSLYRFLGWSGSVGGTQADTTVVLHYNASARALFQKPGEELIRNGKFASNLDGWNPSMTVYTTPTGYPNLLWNKADSSMNLWSQGPGISVDAVYASQPGLTVGMGRLYTIEFDAKCGVLARNVSVSIRTNEGEAGKLQISMSNTKYAHFRGTVTISKNLSENASIRLAAGGDTSQVFFDNVSMKLIEGTPKDDILSGIAHRGGFSVNSDLGAFLQGDVLSFKALRGDDVKIRIYAVDGTRLGVWSGVSNGSNSMNLIETFPGLSAQIGYVIVSTQTGSQTLTWNPSL